MNNPRYTVKRDRENLTIQVRGGELSTRTFLRLDLETRADLNASKRSIPAQIQRIVEQGNVYDDLKASRVFHFQREFTGITVQANYEKAVAQNDPILAEYYGIKEIDNSTTKLILYGAVAANSRLTKLTGKRKVSQIEEKFMEHISMIQHGIVQLIEDEDKKWQIRLKFQERRRRERTQDIAVGAHADVEGMDYRDARSEEYHIRSTIEKVAKKYDADMGKSFCGERENYPLSPSRGIYRLNDYINIVHLKPADAESFAIEIAKTKLDRPNYIKWAVKKEELVLVGKK